MNQWAIEDEFAEYLYNRVQELDPKTIIELGSGRSTEVICSALEGREFKITSVDSNREFMERTKENVNSKNVEFVYAPIVDGWYDKTNIPKSCDLLFVDGPVGSICKNARFPAIFINTKVLIMHDANRPDEREIIKLWTEMYPNAKITHINNPRGGVEIIF